jgi:chromosome segregation ATPase
MSDNNRSQDEIAASVIISMSNEARGSSTDGQVVPATQAATSGTTSTLGCGTLVPATQAATSATTSTLGRGTLENQQQWLRHFLTPPAPRVSRSPSVKKLRKTDKTILTNTQAKKLLVEFAKAESENRPMRWTELSKLHMFQGHFTPEVLRNRGNALWKAHKEEQEHKKRVNATRMMVLDTFIEASNELAKMQEIVDELQADVSRLTIEVHEAKNQSSDSEKVLSDAAAQLEKVRQDLTTAEKVAQSTKLRQHELEQEIAQSKAAVDSAEMEKLRLELDLKRKAELDELKKRLEELYKERAEQEVEAAKIAKEKEEQKIWISGLNEQLDIQAAIASKANKDNETLKRCLMEKVAELEKSEKRRQATVNTMEWLTTVEKSIKATALHIDDRMGLNLKKVDNPTSGK